MRVLPRKIPALSELGLPESLYELTKSSRGLVIVTGATGSGKTTTLAALVDRINRTERRHVVTIEDPVEYEHAHGTSIVEQIEVGVDAPSFSAALVAALRQDPDVLLVGEMRDLETTRTALTAAETGHIVLTTLHTNDVPQTVNRILDIFPPEQQGQVRHQLSLALTAIVCQQLVPRKDAAGRVVATEILIANDAIRNHIRRGSFHQLHSELTLGRRLGMMTMEDSLAALVRNGSISEAEARLRASHPEDLRV
jgi:twitching motility protein PilT